MASGVISEVAIGGLQDTYKWEGLNTSIKDPRALRLGQSPLQLNWITSREGDNIQLRRGQLILGQTRRSGGTCTGIGVGILTDSQVPFYSANKSIYYYNESDDDTHEVNTADVLGTAADGEDVTFMPYQNLAGSWVYATSPHSGVFKMPVANAGSVVNQNVSSYRFQYARIDQNRVFGVSRYGTAFAPDLTSLYVSNVDRSAISTYPDPTVNFTVGTGDGSTKAFSNTLTVAAPNTVFSILVGGAITNGTSVSNVTASSGILTITSSSHGLAIGDLVMLQGVSNTGDPVNGNIGTVLTVPDANMVTVSPTAPVDTFAYTSGGTIYKLEVFVDQGQGTLVSNQGGTGTINYATGAISVTFVTAPVTGVNVIADYYQENATDGGIWDFSYASTNPSIGQGYQFQQGGGGQALAVAGFQGVQYAFHVNKSWVTGIPVSTAADYADATNNDYWSLIGIPSRLAVYPTGDGVLYLDNTNPATPKYSILSIPPGSTNLTVVPQWISQDLDLSLYDFSKAVVYRWSEYNVLCCEKIVNGQVQPGNQVFLMQNIYSGKWNLLDYAASCLANFDGSLLGGDSLSPNVETLFSGLDDDGSNIANIWTSGETDFDFSGLKKLNYLVIQGLIQKEQQIQVSLNLDGAGLVPVSAPGFEDGIIYGTGSYVNASSPVTVGANTVGNTVVGGGATITALPFTIEIPVHTDLFQYISIGFEALNVGWAQINRCAFKDIRLKRLRLQSTQQASGVME